MTVSPFHHRRTWRKGKWCAEREDGYDITVASEIMAILCLSKDIADLKERLGKIIVGYTYGKIADQKNR